MLSLNEYRLSQDTHQTVEYAIWAAPREKVSSSMRKMHRFRFVPRMGSLIRAFALHCYIFQWPMILLADNECPDQIVRMRRLIWASTALICPNTCFRMARPIYLTFWKISNLIYSVYVTENTQSQSIHSSNIKGNFRHFQRYNTVTIIFFPSEKRFSLKGTNLLPMGTNPFLLD